jgi:hypothetical protein
MALLTATPSSTIAVRAACCRRIQTTRLCFEPNWLSPAQFSFTGRAPIGNLAAFKRMFDFLNGGFNSEVQLL